LPFIDDHPLFFMLILVQGFLSALSPYLESFHLSALEDLPFSLLACPVNIPFNDLIQLFYPFTDFIAQSLEETSSIHLLLEFHHPTKIKIS